jgi:hypothetical protein
MIDIRTNSDTPTSDPIPPHIYSIHQSLIQQNIITHPEIITCSQQWIKKEEKDIPNPSKSKRVKRCHYVNHCPICNHLRKQKVHAEMNPYRQVLLDNGGKNILLTFTLRHFKSHLLITLQEVLSESIKKLKESRPYSKQLFPSEHRLYTLTEYEISWSEEFGYAPHCHLQIGTTNPMQPDEIQSLLAKEWRRIVSKVTPYKNFIPSYEKGVDVSDNPSGKHSKDKDPYGLDAIKKLQKKSNRTMKERFRKKDSFSQFQMQSHVAEKTTSFTQFISVLKEIYTTTLKRFRSLFFNPNPHHPLFSQVTSQSK